MMNDNQRNFRFVVAIAVTVLFIIAAPSTSTGFQVSPSVALVGSWDSNVYNTNTDETSDYIFRALPRLTFFQDAYQTTIQIGGGIQSEVYADNSELNKTVATSDVYLTVEDPLLLTPRLTLRPYFRFVNSNDPVRRNELTQFFVPGIPPSEAVITARGKEKEYRGYLLMGYRVTPKIDIYAGGGVTQRKISESTQFDSQDSRRVNVDTSFLYRLTPRLSSGVFYNAGFYSWELAPDNDTHTVGLQGRYRLTELYTLTLRGGSTFLDGPATVVRDGWYPYGSLDLRYQRQYFGVFLRSSYELAGGSDGQMVKRGSVVLRMENQISEKWSWHLRGYYQTNVSLDNPATVDVDTIYGGGGIEYHAYEWASVLLRGDIIRQSSSGLQVNDVDRESVFLGASVSKPYKPY